MATRKNAKKTTKKAEMSTQAKATAVGVGASSVLLSKHAGKKGMLTACIFLVVGLLIAVGTWWFLCRDDTFELLGSTEVTLTLDEQYSDEGVKIVAFGKDDSKNFEIETNLKISNGKYYSDEVGTFYIKYKTNNFKYGKLFSVEKIRLVTFVEASEGGE